MTSYVCVCQTQDEESSRPYTSTLTRRKKFQALHQAGRFVYWSRRIAVGKGGRKRGCVIEHLHELRRVVVLCRRTM